MALIIPKREDIKIKSNLVIPARGVSEEKAKNVREVGFPENMGGGRYLISDKSGELIKSPRSQSALPSIGTAERDHIISVALGGTSGRDNLQYLATTKEGRQEGKVSVEQKAINDYVSGKISLGEARLAVQMKQLQIKDLAPEDKEMTWQGQIGNVIKDAVKNVFKPLTKESREEAKKYGAYGKEVLTEKAKSIKEVTGEDIKPEKVVSKIKTLNPEQQQALSAKSAEKATEMTAKVVTAPIRFTAGSLATGLVSYGLEKADSDGKFTPKTEAEKLLIGESEIQRLLKQEDLYGTIARGAGVPVALLLMAVIESPFISGTGASKLVKEAIEKQIKQLSAEQLAKLGTKEITKLTNGVIRAEQKAGKLTTQQAEQAVKELSNIKVVENVEQPKLVTPKRTIKEPLVVEAKKYKTVSESKFGVRFNEEVKDRAIQLYKEGKSSTQISKEMGISSASVLSWTEKAGIKRTISQSKILYEKDIPKVIELYKQGKNTTEISKELNLVPSSVARWVKEAGITRSNSEAQSILAELGKTNVLGVRSKVSTKFGVIPADSTYEAIRIKQLEADPNIVSIKRATRIPFGENRHYVPDIEIKYKDGSTIIEEIKPVYKLGDEKIIAKEKAAKEFYKDKNTEYRIITENDIGVDAFKNANLDNLIFGSEEIKSRFLNAINKAKSKTKSQLTDIWNKAQKTPELKYEPTIAQPSVPNRIKDSAIEKGLQADFRGIEEYDKISFKDQSKLVGDIIDTDPEMAIKIALGKELPKNGALPESVFMAVKNQAIKNGDTDLLIRLATEEGGVAKESTVLGQRIKMLDEQLEDDAFRNINQVVKARRAKLEKSGVSIPKAKSVEINKIKSEIVKAKPVKDEWLSFIDEIEC